MFLHKLGGNRTQGDWESLAISLQAKGYAIMTFDFRGHGDSGPLDTGFAWSLLHLDLALHQDRQERLHRGAGVALEPGPFVVGRTDHRE